MSLFPAYTSDAGPSNSITGNQHEIEEETGHWLKNSSFVPPEPIADDDPIAVEKESTTIADVKKNDSRKHGHSKKKLKRLRNESIQNQDVILTGNENFYIDKNPIRSYLSVRTLHKPACPRYFGTFRLLGKYRKKFPTSTKRYFMDVPLEDKGSNESKIDYSLSIISEESYAKQNKDFNKRLLSNPSNDTLWIEYVHFQNKAPIKRTKTEMAKRKMELLEKAIIHNLGNENLYKLYIQIINATYPSFDVIKFLDKLLVNDPTSYVLWSAQIYATQGSMALCIVPDVLKLYEQCMQKMYRNSQSDEILLKLFRNCALFLRQSGLNEKFFALIKLALELNVSVDQFQTIQPKQEDQQNLIDYEEVILRSGLPMNEIWLRIEKLRQNYNFLPYPVGSPCSDLQRIVFNEDICYFIYPLKQRENTFYLILIILQLLKVPFPNTSCLSNHFVFKADNMNDFDAIEDILSIFLNRSTNILNNYNEFDHTLYNLMKEIAVGPSYFNTFIGNEIYTNAITEFLLLCSECYTNDKRKREIFILLWLKFQRILIILHTFSSKLTDDHIKSIKNKVKNLLKKIENRSVLNFYTEYALIECEFGNFNTSENIFCTSLSTTNSDTLKSDLYHGYLTYTEVLLKENNPDKALKVLTYLALEKSLEDINDVVISAAQKLSALAKFTNLLEQLVNIERNVEIMEVEQYFLPDYFVSLLKAKIYYQVLISGKLETLASLDLLLKCFIEKNSRHTFIRQNIYELYIKMLQWPDKRNFISNLLIYDILMRAVTEFPENLFLLRSSATLDAQPWIKICSLFSKSHNPVAVLFLISSARYRYLKNESSLQAEQLCLGYMSSNIDSCESTYYRRVYNILKQATNQNEVLRKNPIIWRLYLRSLADNKATFEKSKNILYAALDECPWHKALYMDGSVFVPQELSQIQDLIIEKQLRLYALPEELEILREDPIESSAINM